MASFNLRTSKRKPTSSTKATQTPSTSRYLTRNRYQPKKKTSKPKKTRVLRRRSMQIKAKRLDNIQRNGGGASMATSSPEPKGTLTPPGSSPLRADCGSIATFPSTMSPEAPPTPDSAYMTEAANHGDMLEIVGGDERRSPPLTGARKRKAAKVHKVESDCIRSVESSESSLVCPVCNIHLTTQHDFTRHIRTHNRIIDDTDGTKLFECGLCHKTLSSNSSLDRHMLVHSGERPFKCHICGTLFTTNGNMHRHIRGHNRHNGIGGSDSGESDASDAEGSTRKRSADSDDGGPNKIAKYSDSEPDNFNCSLCGMDFDNHKILAQHLSEEHNEYRSTSSLNHTGHQYSDTSVGKYSFLPREQSNSPVESIPKCGSCNITFHSVEAWLRHIPEHRQDKYAEKETTFDSISELTSQRETHETKPSFYDTLSKITPAAVSLYQGRTLQMLSQPFHNDKTPAVSGMTPMSFSQHNLSHEEQFDRGYRDMKISGQYPCRICKQVFANLRKLKSHNVVHMVAPPYECNLCSFVSNDKNTLKEHMKNHKGDTPYGCSLCTLSFTTKANCERHIKNIHGKTREEIKNCMTYRSIQEDEKLPSDKPIDTTCQVCSIDCKSKSVLRDHIRSSHPESIDKAYACKSCLETFNSFNDGLRHVIHAHPDSSNIEGLVERRVRDDIPDLSPVESLLSMSKFSIPLGSNKIFPDVRPPPRIVTPSFDLSVKPIPRFSSPISILAPGFAGLHSSSGTESDAPLDLSMNSKKRDLESDEEIIVTDDDSPKDLTRPNKFPKLDHKSQDGITKTIESDIQRESNFHPFYPSHISPTFYPFTNPFLSSPFGLVPPITPNFFEQYQKGLKRDLSLSSGGNLLNPVNSLISNNQSCLQLSALAFAASQNEKLKTSSPSPSNTAQNTTKIEEDNQICLKKNLLVKKQKKQIRYRTERPWRCDKCEKGFTLRSNMDRHMKQQHPDSWQKPKCTKPGQCIQGEQLCDSTSLTVECKSKENFEKPENQGDSKEEDETELIIDDEEDWTDEDPDSDSRDMHDLASVGQLLSTASSQSFPFFPKDPEETDIENSNQSTQEQIDEAKRSAYSSAPQKLECNHCGRKFPWSSSLVRHLRTHTGQKPYMCPVCNFPFTTKSNCDRHLQRKHPDSPHTLCGDRPYRCEKCPGSTFTSLESLRKHEMFKHERVQDVHDVLRCYRSLISDKEPHSGQSHEIESDEENDDEKPSTSTTETCSECECRFSCTEELSNHMAVHKDKLKDSISNQGSKDCASQKEGTSDFISNMLDTKPAVIDQLLNSKSASDAAKLLGVR